MSTDLDALERELSGATPVWILGPKLGWSKGKLYKVVMEGRLAGRLGVMSFEGGATRVTPQQAEWIFRNDPLSGTDTAYVTRKNMKASGIDDLQVGQTYQWDNKKGETLTIERKQDGYYLTFDAEGRTVGPRDKDAIYRLLRAYMSAPQGKHLQKGHLIGTDDEAMTADFVLSTMTEDRDGETVNPEGGDFSEYEKNPVVCFNHDTDDFPIGMSQRLWVDEVDGQKALMGKVQFSRANPKGRLAYEMVKEGTLKGCSISFLPTGEVGKNSSGGNHYSKWKLLEWSVCPVGSNPDAVRLCAKRLRTAKIVKTADAATIARTEGFRVTNVRTRPGGNFGTYPVEEFDIEVPRMTYGQERAAVSGLKASIQAHGYNVNIRQTRSGTAAVEAFKSLQKADWHNEDFAPFAVAVEDRGNAWIVTLGRGVDLQKVKDTLNRGGYRFQVMETGEDAKVQVYKSLQKDQGMRVSGTVPQNKLRAFAQAVQATLGIPVPSSSGSVNFFGSEADCIQYARLIKEHGGTVSTPGFKSKAPEPTTPYEVWGVKDGEKEVVWSGEGRTQAEGRAQQALRSGKYENVQIVQRPSKSYDVVDSRDGSTLSTHETEDQAREAARTAGPEFDVKRKASSRELQRAYDRGNSDQIAGKPRTGRRRPKSKSDSEIQEYVEDRGLDDVQVPEDKAKESHFTIKWEDPYGDQRTAEFNALNQQAAIERLKQTYGDEVKVISIREEPLYESLDKGIWTPPFSAQGPPPEVVDANGWVVTGNLLSMQDAERMVATLNQRYGGKSKSVDKGEKRTFYFPNATAASLRRKYEVGQEYDITYIGQTYHVRVLEITDSDSLAGKPGGGKVRMPQGELRVEILSQKRLRRKTMDEQEGPVGLRALRRWMKQIEDDARDIEQKDVLSAAEKARKIMEAALSRAYGDMEVEKPDEEMETEMKRKAWEVVEEAGKWYIRNEQNEYLETPDGANEWSSQAEADAALAASGQKDCDPMDMDKRVGGTVEERDDGFYAIDLDGDEYGPYSDRGPADDVVKALLKYEEAEPTLDELAEREPEEKEVFGFNVGDKVEGRPGIGRNAGREGTIVSEDGGGVVTVRFGPGNDQRLLTGNLRHKRYRRIKRLSKAQTDEVMELAETLDDMAQSTDLPKRYKGTLLRGAESLKALATPKSVVAKDDISEDEETRLEQAIKDLELGEERISQSLYQATGKRL